MPRPDRSDQRRAELIPTLAAAFAQLGFAGATSAKLAEACGLAENQLYRLWPSKKAMFLAVIDHLYRIQEDYWTKQLSEGDPATAIARILEREGKERGSTGLHRVLFAGLSASDDPEIRSELNAMYKHFHRFIRGLLKRQASVADPDLAAWALIGLGTVSNIARELDLFPVATQRKLMRSVGGPLAGLD